VRGSGFLLGFKIDGASGALQKALLERGIIVGTSNAAGVLRLLPPLTLSHVHVDSFLKVLADELKRPEFRQHA
jgi:acetylornithine/succinyldiaminopimelate/putrescine aminotransferase